MNANLIYEFLCKTPMGYRPPLHHSKAVFVKHKDHWKTVDVV